MRHISTSNLHKRFGDVTALAGVDLEVHPGQSVVILGPSGSGKSTLLRILAGLEEADEGEVRFDGKPQKSVPPHERDVAIVFQSFALYPHLTAEENITLGLRHGLGLSRSEAAKRARDISARLEIEDLLERKPREMSGGQRQRVALARALARESGVVLLDEPLSGLDAQLRALLRVEIASLMRSSGASVIHVTHDQSDAMSMADKVVVMDQGTVVQEGTPEDVYRQPASVFVARFLGSPPMNLMSSESVGVSNGDFTWGVRPEDLSLYEPGDMGVRGRIAASELNGADWTAYVDIGNQVIAVRTAAKPPDIGAEVMAGAPRSVWHRFDASGKRIVERD